MVGSRAPARSELDFGFCDGIVNETHGHIIAANDDRPDIYWEVFLAFDSGESYPNNDRSRDPVQTFARPQIAKIVEQHVLDYPDI